MKIKNELRKKIKEKRKILDILSKSKIITEKIRNSAIYSESKSIMLFYPTKYEVNLLDLLSDNKNFYFPKVHGENLLVCPISETYEKSELGIYEPCTNPINPNELDLIIVPALAVDKFHYRLGYGGGYYDKFLAKHFSIKTLTPIFKEFIYDELPKNKYDIKVNYIVSD